MARKVLAHLVELGFAVKTGRTKGTIYTLSEQSFGLVDTPQAEVGEIIKSFESALNAAE